MNYLYFSLIFMLIFIRADGALFDRYSGKKLDDVKSHPHATNENCTIEVIPCTPHEGSRVDGTCNNYKHPSRGSARGPYLRMLNPDYGSNGSIRENRNGKPLPSARKVRTMLQSTGRVEDKVHFNLAAVTLLDFIRLDVSLQNGPLDFLRDNCCEKKDDTDHRCANIYVPHDDPYLRVTGISCLNYSRSGTFQDNGCLPKEEDPEQVNLQTPLLDLSTIYGPTDNDLKKVRKYHFGLLKEEQREGRYFPTNETDNVCVGNKLNNSICYRFGHQNMLNYDLISDHIEHVTTYQEDTEPLVFQEFEIALQFFRTFQDGRIKKYDEQYRYSGELSFSETLFRTELLEKESNFEEINRGTFYQHAAKIDDIQDPEIVERFYGAFQKASDQVAIDIQKGRDFGIQGYNGYRKFCGLHPATKFEDFLDAMSIEKMEALKYLYEDVEDVDLLAGIMSENFIQGTFVGPTLFCIISKQIEIFRFADRFWFERGKQYHSFSLPQLNEIKKTNMARFACDNGEGIKYIQPQALLNVGPGNIPTPCTHIPGPDFSRWYDDSCKKHQDLLYPSPKYTPEYHNQEDFKAEPQKLVERFKGGSERGDYAKVNINEYGYTRYNKRMEDYNNFFNVILG